MEAVAGFSGSFWKAATLGQVLAFLPELPRPGCLSLPRRGRGWRASDEALAAPRPWADWSFQGA